MNKADIKLGDLGRIFMGEVPPIFFIEVILRTAVIFLILMIAMRLLGKRMATRLSGAELAALVSLAAAVGVPIAAPDRGLLPAVAIALVVVVVQRFIGARSFKDQEFEKLSQGDLTVVVADGVMQMDKMEKTRLTPERVRAQLRSEGLKHMGAVKRLYMEATGGFSLIKNEDPQPGLSLMPEWDHEMVDNLPYVEGAEVCSECGNPKANSSGDERCENCGQEKWTGAVK